MSATKAHPDSLLLNIIASRIGYFIVGIGLSVWAPLVPYVRLKTPMNDATFGLMLLCIGIGSLTCMPTSAALTNRCSIRHCLVVITLILLSALLTVATATSLWILGFALFLFGGSMGVLDVILNVQGLSIEHRANRSMMSNFHGMFSLGTIVGSILMTALLMLGLSALLSTLCVISLMLILSLFAFKGYLDERTLRSQDTFIWPNSWIFLVGLMCFIVYLAEGVILDWSALFLIEEKQIATAQAGLGYASFAVLVATGRFLGDAIVESLGRVRVLVGGGLIAASGIVLSIVSPHWSIALIGYALCGLGSANVSPVLISTLNKQTHMPPHLAITAATTIGFAGVLAGPAMMGVVAHYSSLSIAFTVVAGALLVVAACGPRFK
ncbi:MFS transporter [Denitrificimonas sp. JX-1]|uniref:MFS transporter n=1 Tax=Denitrificimonas halotolerans TaxID=3098930 RepID=A0ABU5GQS8_9GAMM|nr:MFS transporter [Denitrificimonas sp. JX-1]MDY7218897.1 MFS transporter [Denitrificimonas sp. JX-1]